MSAPAQAAGIANECLSPELTDTGTLSRIDNLLAGEVCRIQADTFAVATDRGLLSNRDAVQVERDVAPGRARYVFRNGELYDVAIEYTLKPGRRYLGRHVALTNVKVPLTLLNIELGRTVFAVTPGEFVQYGTFWNCPTVSFLRWAEGGLFAGIENPFFRTACRGNEATFSFEPALLLKPGDTYESEPQFIGVYRKHGVTIADHNRKTRDGGRPRFRNPCGHVPLDRGEIRAMQQFAADYLDVRTDGFCFILYSFFYPLPQMPRPGCPEEACHLGMIDRFHELGGDTIIFNPLWPYRRPGPGTDSYWDLAPDGSAARKILDHAASQGIRFGFYMGCARHGGEGNACALPFAPERKEWEKVDAEGAVAGENCMASDAFAEWWYAVQRNTIAKFRLGLWSWDPGPGNGLFCYSGQHGHLPGKGGYKGWRNATALMRRLRAEFPGIYFQAYYGRKEYGLWGLRYFDQHESYWEQTVPFRATMHPDVHADRVNADGIRFQSWWNQTFRFLPSAINHAMVHRIQEGIWDTRLPLAWDSLGWRYSVMSGLAVGGSITTVILPEDLDAVPGMREFYRKWLGWARKNFEYVRYNVPFGDQVRPGGIDGWARIKGDHGYLFLCNPGPRPARTEFVLGDEIGLETKGRFTLRELYPVEGRNHFDEKYRRGVFSAGDRVSMGVPAYEVVLLELSAFKEDQLPLVFGINGDVQRDGSPVAVSGATGQPGEAMAV